MSIRRWTVSSGVYVVFCLTKVEQSFSQPTKLCQKGSYGLPPFERKQFPKQTLTRDKEINQNIPFDVRLSKFLAFLGIQQVYDPGICMLHACFDSFTGECCLKGEHGCSGLAGSQCGFGVLINADPGTPHSIYWIDATTDSAYSDSRTPPCKCIQIPTLHFEPITRSVG